MADDDFQYLGEDDFDEDEGFRIDMSDKEADSSVREFTPIPRGHYLLNITDVTLEESKSTKNLGKPMFNFQFTVDASNPDYAGRILYNRAMLWEGAAYTIAQLQKAVGRDPKSTIPPARWWLGKQVVGAVKVVPKMGKNPDSGVYDIPQFEDADQKVRSYQNDFAGFMAPSDPKVKLATAADKTATKTKADSGVSSLLPS